MSVVWRAVSSASLLSCSKQMGFPGVAGCWLARLHQRVGMETSALFEWGLLIDCGSFSYISGLLVCLDEGLVTPVLLLQGRCRNPFHSIRIYSWPACPQITHVLGLKTTYILQEQDSTCIRRSSIFLGKIKNISEFRLDEVLYIFILKYLKACQELVIVSYIYLDFLLV